MLDANPLRGRARPTPIELPRPGAARSRSTHVTFGYLRSEPVLTTSRCTSPPARSSPLVGASGSGKSTVSLLLPRFYDVQEGESSDRRRRRARRHPRLAPPPGRRGVRGRLPLLRHRAGQHRLRPARRHRRRGRAAAAVAGARRLHHRAARRLRHRRRRARAHPLGRATPAHRRWPGRSSPTRASSCSTTPPRRSTPPPRRPIHETLRELMAGPHDHPHRPPPLDPAPGRPHRARRRWAGGRRGHPRGAAATSARYRDLLAGPGDDAETRGRPGPRARARRHDRTRALGTRRRGGGVGVPRRRPDRRPGGPGGSGVGAGGRGWWRPRAGAHTRTARRARRPPPARRRPTSTWPPRRRHASRFRLRGFVRPYRRALLIGLGLVVVDTILTLLGPFLVRGASTRACRTTTRRCLWTASALFLAVVARRLGRDVGLHRCHRPHRRAAAVRPAGEDLRPPAAALPRLLRPRAGGPDHDPHDHRRRGALAAGADRPHHRRRRHPHLRRACSSCSLSSLAPDRSASSCCSRR